MRSQFKLHKTTISGSLILISMALLFLINLRRGNEFRFLDRYVPVTIPYGARQEILDSEWIRYFPHLEKAVKNIAENSSEAITNANNIKIELEKGKQGIYNIGDVVNAKIIVFNNTGRKKLHGGDFFSVILRRPNSKTDGVSCNVEDHCDGTFSVRCILPWEGEAILTAILAHPIESLLQLMLKYSSEKHYGLDIVTIMLNSRNVQEKTICAIGFPNKRSEELCDYTNPSHGEKRMCLKPHSGECSKIVDQYIYKEPSKKSLYDKCYFVKGFNFHTPIQGSGIRLKVRYRSAKKTQSHSNSQLSLDPMTPTGFWFNSIWTSLKPRMRVGTDEKSVQKCVQNKRLYFFGDSTMRIIYLLIVKILKLIDKAPGSDRAWSRKRDAEQQNWNLTMHYRSHGPPLLNPGPENARPYMSDSFDAIKSGGDGTVVIFTIGYHFQLLDPDVFLNRIRIIKGRVVNLIERLPGIKVVVKGLHYHSVDIADRLWLSYRLEILLRNEFKDIAGVTYLESWDLTMVPNNAHLHPVPDLLKPTISDFLGTFC